MKNLLKKIFKKETQIDYIIAEYQPNQAKLLETSRRLGSYANDELANNNEMEIDRLYQHS